MRYAQIKSGQRLHLVFEPGEGRNNRHPVRAGHLGTPLCGRHVPPGGYRMTINVPLANACRNCLRVWRSMPAEAGGEES